MLAAALLCLSSACTAGQTPRDLVRTNCHDETRADRCDPDVQRSVRALYNVPSVEALSAAGAEVRRAFYVDGYGTDMPVVTFEREPGADPRVTVTVRVPEAAGDNRLVTMSSPVPLQVWNDVLAETRHFDRELVPLPPDGVDDVLEVCLHAWVVTVEAAQPGGERAVRRRTEHACDPGLAIDAAFAMARRAYGLLPHCQALSAPQYRHEVTLLETCGLLEGDRLAAAEAMNQFTDLRRRYPAPTPADLVVLVHDAATLEWPGEAPAQGLDEAARYWASHVIDHDLQMGRVHGEGSNRVRMTGRILTPPDDDGRLATASVEQVWTRENGFGFRLREMRVGAFVRVSSN